MCFIKWCEQVLNSPGKLCWSWAAALTNLFMLLQKALCNIRRYISCRFVSVSKSTNALYVFCHKNLWLDNHLLWHSDKILCSVSACFETSYRGAPFFDQTNGERFQKSRARPSCTTFSHLVFHSYHISNWGWQSLHSVEPMPSLFASSSIQIHQPNFLRLHKINKSAWHMKTCCLKRLLGLSSNSLPEPF